MTLSTLYLQWTPDPVIVTRRDYAFIRVLIYYYHYYRVGVHLTYTLGMIVL